jgi:putative chitinase
VTNTRLSKYFTLSELIFSQTAARKGIDNTPSEEIVQRLSYTANCLDAVRALLDAPIIVSSGYRCPELNRAVGSKATVSAHTLGYAVDFVCPGYGNTTEVFSAIRSSAIPYDQLILECPQANGGWVHISFDPRMRKQALFTDDAATYHTV